MYKSNDLENVIQNINTSDDGTYTIEVTKGIYTIEYVKPGYLKYTIKDIEITDSNILLDDAKIIAGDINGD